MVATVRSNLPVRTSRNPLLHLWSLQLKQFLLALIIRVNCFTLTAVAVTRKVLEISSADVIEKFLIHRIDASPFVFPLVFI